MENPKKTNIKVLHQETKANIPNIEVTVYDLSQQPGPPQPPPPQGGADESIRLGSGVTDEQGICIIEYSGDSPDGPGPSNGAALVVTLTAPFRSADGNEETIVLATTPTRRNASPNENFLLELTTQQLLDAGLPVPGISITSGDPEQEEAVKESFDQRLRQHFRHKFQFERDRVRNFEIEFRKSISKIREDDPSVLQEDDDLDVKQKEVVQKKIAEVNGNPVNAEGIILLTPEQQELLAPYMSQDGDQYENVPAYIIDPILYPSVDDKKKPTFLLRNNPVASYCRKKTTEEIYSEMYLEDQSSETETGDEEAPPLNGTLTPEDIPKHLSKLIGLQTSPEETVSFGKVETSRRPDQADVQNAINSFILEKGPADSVAYYDFHNIQIAFNHIWQEAIDNGVLDLAKGAYGKVVDLIGPLDGDDGAGASVKNPGDLLKISQQLQQATITEPPAKVCAKFDITYEQWNNLSYRLQQKLIELADTPAQNAGQLRVQERSAQRIIAIAEENSYRSLHKIMLDLNKRLRENYAFYVFPVKENGQRSVNFGLITTYRQKWEPLNYQAGELVKTITLAPKEERKYSFKTVVNRKRSEKEIQKYSSSRREEMNMTTRAEADIIRKAMTKTNFNLSSNGSFSIGLYQGDVKTSLARDAQNDSQETKKDFREAVRKASQEYKSERSMEVSTEETYETEITESGTISNPNDELAVTYLFYELQRRYRVSEEIHRLTPIVLVAARVPEPHEVDEDWLIAHDWILRRVILDDSFLPALSYLSTSIVGDEYALKELNKNLKLQRRLVEELKQEVSELQEQAKGRYEALEDAIADRIEQKRGEEADGLAVNLNEWVWGLDLKGDARETPEVAKAVEQAAEDAHEHAVMQAKEATSKLQKELSELNAISEKYSKLLSQHLNRKTQVERCKAHIKDNILYYMQAIWSHQPPDQRFFELHNTMVPHFEIEEKSYTVDAAAAENIWTSTENGATPHKFQLNTNIKPELTYKTLIEIADVDNLLGFKGNYMIFPLKEPNALTDFMMTPYVDMAFGLRDPDEFGNMNLRDFAKYICCLHEEMSEAEFEAIKPVLQEYYKFLLTSPLREGEDLVVPTDSLFIEALPAKHALLEDFKLMHRAIDVKKVQAEVREMEIDNLRQAARILVDNFEDPDTEKIIVPGNSVQPSIDLGSNS